MAGLGRKVFASGDILLASEVQGFLQDQAVMVFDDDAARTAAIATPTEGMVTFRKDDNALEVFDGSVFVAVGGGAEPGLVHIKSQTVSAVSSVIFNDVFSATFDSYIINFALIKSTSSLFTLRFRAGGTPFTGAFYNVQRLNAEFGSVINSVTGGQTSQFVGRTATGSNMGQILVGFPFPARQTVFQIQTVGETDRDTHVSGSNHGLNVSVDGFEINISTGTTTGSVTVLGVQK